MFEQTAPMIRKPQFIDKLAGMAQLSRPEAEKIVNAFLDSVEDAICLDGKLSLKGFGSFVVVSRQSRKGVNPQTGEDMVIPESRSVKFVPSPSLKDLLNP